MESTAIIHSATPKRTILVVDNDRLMLRLVSEMLKLAGYNTLEADSPEQALQIFEHDGNEIDLLLSDLTMPRMDGRALGTRLCAGKADLAVIFMSGHNTGPECGNDVLQKPFGIDELHLKVAEALTRDQHAETG